MHCYLFIDSRKHEALWCMGSALTSLAIMTPDQDSAKDLFYFQKAIDVAGFTSTIDFL